MSASPAAAFPTFDASKHDRSDALTVVADA